MVKQKTVKCISYNFNLIEFIKPEFLIKNKGKHVSIEIIKDKEYGAVAKLFQRKDFFSRFHETITDEQRKKLSENLDKAFKDNKPVDTSKWMKPDEESIRNELIRNLFLLEILKEDYWGWKSAQAKAQAYYWLLHGNSPKNPQGYVNYMIEPFFKTILSETKAPKYQEYRKISFRNPDGKTLKELKPRPTEKARRMFKEFKEECLKNMILREM